MFTEIFHGLPDPDGVTGQMPMTVTSGATHTEIPNEASLSMIKFAKGLTDKYGVKTPIEPKGKPTNGNSNEPDPFEAALTGAGVSGIG